MTECKLAQLLSELGCLGDENTCDDEKHNCVGAQIEEEIVKIRTLFLVLKQDLEEVRNYRLKQGGQSCGPPCNELLNAPPSAWGYLDRFVSRGLALTEGFKNE